MIARSMIVACIRVARNVRVWLLLAVAAACGGASGDDRAAVQVDTLPGGVVRVLSSGPTEAGRWSLAPGVRVQPPAESEGELLEPRDLAVLDDGTLLVSESEGHVKVFAPDGRYLRRIARRGSGPGEFRVGFIAARGDTLFVQDPLESRASTFRISDGAFLGSRSTACCYWGPIRVAADGRAIVRSGGGTREEGGATAEFQRVSFDLTQLDTLRVPYRGDPDVAWEINDGDRMQMRMSVPFVPQEVQEVDARGLLVTAFTGEYRLRVSGTGTDTTVLFGRAFEAEPVTSAEKSRLVDARIESMLADGGPIGEVALRRALDPDRIPDVRVPFERFMIDAAGRTWVRRTRPDTTRLEFDLFGADRVWLDTVHVPAEGWPTELYAPSAWGSGHVAVAMLDDEGRPFVQVYRIVRGDAGATP